MKPGPLWAGAVPVLALVLLVTGCARPGAPEGGPVPEIPPLVVGTSPDTFAVVEPFRSPVRFEFDVALSERPTSGQLRDAVVVSPRTGDVSVRHRGERVEVRVEGGFREGLVYRVSLRPVLQDRYQNRMAAPFDLFFSTGPEFEPNLVAGLLVDRISGREAEGARVDAVPEAGGPAHSTVADSLGVFAFPYLPSGQYRIVAYEDRNRSREADFTEPQDSAAVMLARGDTLVLTDMALLMPDTTSAVLGAARALDSVAVELEFDDYLDPDRVPASVSARLTRDEADGPDVAEVLHEHEWQERERERLAREAAEAPPPDPDAPDPDVPEPPAEPEPEPPPPEDPEAPPEERPILPSQLLVLVLTEPLEGGAEYEVTVEGVENINGVPGGGGTVELIVPEPEPEPEPDAPAPPDTTGVAPADPSPTDTISAVRDGAPSMAAPADTSPSPPARPSPSDTFLRRRR